MVKRKARSHAEWLELIREQKTSAQGVGEFCRQRKLAEHSFYYHKRRMCEEAKGGGFQEVAAPQGRGVRIVVEAESSRVEVEPGFDAGCLREVMRALR
jgi:hypothetical protein